MSINNLRAEDLDKLGQALLSLTKELWVVKDRLRVLEATLAQAGVMAPDAVDTHQPDADLAELLDEECSALIKSVLGALEDDEKT